MAHQKDSEPTSVAHQNVGAEAQTGCKSSLGPKPRPSPLQAATKRCSWWSGHHLCTVFLLTETAVCIPHLMSQLASEVQTSLVSQQKILVQRSSDNSWSHDQQVVTRWGPPAGGWTLRPVDVPAEGSSCCGGQHPEHQPPAVSRYTVGARTLAAGCLPHPTEPATAWGVHGAIQRRKWCWLQCHQDHPVTLGGHGIVLLTPGSFATPFTQQVVRVWEEHEATGPLPLVGVLWGFYIL
jgi:hypothetical protein